MNLLEFTKRFQTDADCVSYLMEIKWKDRMKCSKCNSEEFWKGKCSNNPMQEMWLRRITYGWNSFSQNKIPVAQGFSHCYRVCVSTKECLHGGYPENLGYGK